MKESIEKFAEEHGFVKLTQSNHPQDGQTVEILVEDKHKGRWRGRTPQSKLVFFDDVQDWKGKLAQVTVTWTGPYSMSGELEGKSLVTSTPLDSIALPLVG